MRAHQIRNGVDQVQAAAGGAARTRVEAAHQRIVELSGVAGLAHQISVVFPERQPAGAPGVHQAIGGQLGGDQLQILDALLGKPHPPRIVDGERAGGPKIR